MRFSDRRLAITIADVVGKGLPAALLMSSLQATVRALASESVSPRDLCSRVNRLLCRNIASGKFVTFCYCVIDTAQDEVAFGNAGHNPPILVRRSGAVERLQPGGTVLGVFEDSAYSQSRATFAEGDRLVLFTDGITEALNGDGEEFGDERLVDAVVRERHHDADSMLAELFKAVVTFTGGTFQDDATLIVVAREGTGAR
jgi:sigma-B regulation protein RsbU (phosphoserine phosphatase)